ncbi:MAG TPA: ATP-binding protein [Nitrospira sp.]|nr:ATP-binding protein [Nitrospira sp.]
MTDPSPQAPDTFPETLTPLQRLARFARDLGTHTDRSLIARRILTELCEVTARPTGTLYLLDQERERYTRLTSFGKENAAANAPAISSTHPLVTRLAHRTTVLALTDPSSLTPADEGTVPSVLEALQVSIAIPLLSKGRLLAFALLGPLPDSPQPSQDGMELLIVLAQNAANALDSMLLHDDLRQSHTLMRRTDRLRSLEIIAGGFAHEIRNPLTSIKTFIQLAPERREDAEFIRDFSRIVLEDVYRIERLIQEILDYARYMEPTLTDEDLNEVVSSCLYFVEMKTATKRIKIEKELAPDLPRVMLDRQQVQQVLLNLLLNAIDAMKIQDGRLTVRTHRLTRPGNQTWAQIEIEDNGAGISADNLAHIFDPFFTTKHASGEHAGTGLGLTIVHQIVHEHDGDIQVESTEGVGTTFFVNLPAIPIT